MKTLTITACVMALYLASADCQAQIEENLDLKTMDNSQLWQKYIRDLKQEDSAEMARVKTECQRRLKEQKKLDLLEELRRKIQDQKILAT